VEAARALGWPAGTVAARLARARTLLKKRLERRGVTLATALAAAAVADQAPAALMQTTIKAATLFAVGGAAAAGVLPASALVLTKGVLRAMFITRLKIATVVLLTLCTLAAGAGMAGWRARPAIPPDPDPQPGIQAARADEPPAEDLKQRVERLQRENERLNRELHDLRDKVTRLEHKVAPAREGGETVVYEGKPTAYWRRQLKDRSPKYRAAAVEALGAIAPVDRSVVPALVKALSDPGYAVSGTAVSALLALGEDGQHLVFYALRSGSPATRLHVVNALDHERLPPRLPVRVQIPALVRALADKDADVRAAAARALAGIRPIMPAVEVPALTGALNDPVVGVRLNAVQALQRFGSPEATPALLEALRNDNVEVRLAAVTALYSLPMMRPSVYTALVLATQDKSPGVREMARSTVLTHTVRASTPLARPTVARLAIIGLLKHDKNPAVRVAAARLVGSFPLTSETALALHQAAQDDSDPQVRKAAEEAYKHLTSQPKTDEGADTPAQRAPMRGGFGGGRAGRGGRRLGGPGSG